MIVVANSTAGFQHSILFTAAGPLYIGSFTVDRAGSTVDYGAEMVENDPLEQGLT